MTEAAEAEQPPAAKNNRPQQRRQEEGRQRGQEERQGRPAEEEQQTFNTSLDYHCEDGQQFDTDNDGAGDELSVNIREGQQSQCCTQGK